MMTTNYQFGDADAHGATIRAQAMALEAEHQTIVRDVLAASYFWSNFQVICQAANAHGSQVQTVGSNMASTDSAVESS
jgi:hypothetical protein